MSSKSILESRIALIIRNLFRCVSVVAAMHACRFACSLLGQNQYLDRRGCLWLAASHPNATSPRTGMTTVFSPSNPISSEYATSSLTSSHRAFTGPSILYGFMRHFSTAHSSTVSTVGGSPAATIGPSIAIITSSGSAPFTLRGVFRSVRPLFEIKTLGGYSNPRGSSRGYRPRISGFSQLTRRRAGPNRAASGPGTHSHTNLQKGSVRRGTSLTSR